MPKPVNEELKRAIVREAFSSFLANGYTNTSYSHLAQRCGTSKALVNYYFPKKENLLHIFMEKLLGETLFATLGKHDLEPKDFSSAELFRIGQVYYRFLLDENGCRSMFYDVISDRKLTSSLLDINSTWAYAFIARAEVDMPVSKAAHERAVLLLGGFYDLIFYKISKGEDIDIASLVAYVLSGFMKAMGCSQDEIDRMEADGLMSEAELSDSLGILNEAMRRWDGQ